MKQIEEMFGRFITNRPRLKKKWQMAYGMQDGKPFICFFHYHHLIAVFSEQGLVYEWYETQTDLRGLNEIKKYMLSDSKSIIYTKAREGAKHYELQITHNQGNSTGNLTGINHAVR